MILSEGLLMRSMLNRALVLNLVLFLSLLVTYFLDKYQNVIDFAKRNEDWPVFTLFFSIAFLYFGYLLFLAKGPKNTHWILLGISLFLIQFLIVYIYPHPIYISPDRDNVIQLMLFYYSCIFVLGVISDRVQNLIIENFQQKDR